MSPSPTGSTTKQGYMPHWLFSYPTWLRCWAQFLQQIDLHGAGSDQDKAAAMRDAMMSLQNMVTILMMSAPESPTQWLTVAHLIMSRVYRFCTTLRPEVLGEPLGTMEERDAGNRATAVAPRANASSTPSQPRAAPSRPPSNQKRQRVARGGPPGGGGQAQAAGPPNAACPYHKGSKHTIWQCDRFKALSPPDASDATKG